MFGGDGTWTLGRKPKMTRTKSVDNGDSMESDAKVRPDSGIIVDHDVVDQQQHQPHQQKRRCSAETPATPAVAAAALKSGMGKLSIDYAGHTVVIPGEEEDQATGAASTQMQNEQDQEWYAITDGGK